MMRENYRQICDGKEIRQNLAALRRELSDEISVRDFHKLTGGDFRNLYMLLDHADPKVRKNACAVIGLCRPEKALGLLWRSYEKEKTLFVRPAYLKAMGAYDCSSLKEELRTQERTLMVTNFPEEDRKHRLEELSALRQLLSRCDEKKPHVFRMPAAAPDVILLANRCQRTVTQQQVLTGNTRLLAGGVRVSGGDLGELLQIRTVEEYLFSIPGLRELSGTPEEMGEAIAKSHLLQFLESLHENAPDVPYYFRTELRAPIPPEKKGAWIRTFTSPLERGTGARLRASASGYEVELRMLQKKNGAFVPMLKLYTLPDKRFSYRIGQTSESISPVNAALAIALAKPWLKEGAQVLDPFCGVGTMLIERAQAGKCGMLFGVDHYGDAIRLGRENAELAQTDVHFIQRDFRTFQHAYPFDEVISDLPRQCHDPESRETLPPDDLLYTFFQKIPELLKDKAVLVLYTTSGNVIERAVGNDSRFAVERAFQVNEKNNTKIYVLSYHRTVF